MIKEGRIHKRDAVLRKGRIDAGERSRLQRKVKLAASPTEAN